MLAWVAGCQDRDASVYTPIGELALADSTLKACAVRIAQDHDWPTAGRVETLHCSGAGGPKISSLDGIGVLGNLTDLSVAHNRIRDVSPLLTLRKLVRLDLAFNEIEAIEALPWALHVDLNHNHLRDVRFAASSPNIRTLLLEYNQLEDLRPLGGLEWLSELQVSGNGIGRLDGIDRLTRLKYLVASNNRITGLDPLTGLRQLVSLQLAGNGIDDVTPIAGLIELRTLDLSRNRIEDVAPLAALENLKVLKLSDNPLRNATSLVDLSELHELDVRGVPGFTCTQREALVSAFGPGVVRSDAVCDGDSMPGSDEAP